MTLLQQFESAIGIFMPVERCEKVAEEFAIGFAEWLKDKPRSEFTKESLEIYKKEKGL
jgi:hypothetical protein